MSQTLKSTITSVAIADIIVAEGHNPRRDFDEGRLLDLGKSMKEVTQLAPVLLNLAAGKYYLVAGERRLRAARDAGDGFVEARIFEDLDARQAMRISLAENRERVALNIIERARAWGKAMEVGIEAAEIAASEGLSPETLSRQLKLLSLEDEVQRMMTRTSSPLPIHQALCLVGLAAADQIELARKAAPAFGGRVASEAEVRAWAQEVKDRDAGQGDLPGAPARRRPSRPGSSSRLAPDPDGGVMRRGSEQSEAKKQEARSEKRRTEEGNRHEAIGNSEELKTQNSTLKTASAPSAPCEVMTDRSGSDLAFMSLTGPDSFVVKAAVVEVLIYPLDGGAARRFTLKCDLVLENAGEYSEGDLDVPQQIARAIAACESGAVEKVKKTPKAKKAAASSKKRAAKN